MKKQEPVYSALKSLEIEIIAEAPDKNQPPPPVASQNNALPPLQPLFHFRDVPFVDIPPGSFMMGSPEHEPGRGADETLHEVTLTQGFALQATPVTRAQWQAVMGTSPACFRQGGDDCPVEGISWNDCQAFINRLNAEGEHRYRLPTEAEWEYACRAGTNTPFANGGFSELFCRPDPCLDKMAWYWANSGRKPHPVARKQANAWGLFDMHGNVCEWCQDWYGEYAAVPQTDPPGPDFGPGRVVRGGSWFSNAKNCRSASRFYRPPDSKNDFVGFRLVRHSR